MSISVRCVIPGHPHHVRERGVRRNPIFHEDSDYLVYIRNLKDGCMKHGISITSYALMTNHVHLIAIPEHENSISRGLHDAHTRYAAYFNTKYGFSGHLWDRRPGCNAMDEAHMWNAVRYVERNPVRAGLVERAEDYLWSSAAAHCGLRDDSLIAPDFPPPGVVSDWSEWLRIDLSDEERKAIRRHLSTGRPWGTPEFILQLEALTGRRLTPRKAGRRKRSEPEETPALF